jgi:uncharacterized protein (TIGR01777 family)
MTPIDDTIDDAYRDCPRERVLVSGASGFVGRALCALLAGAGHEALPLTRRPVGPNDVPWNPSSGEISPLDGLGIASVVHLAGESIASGRWTAARKALIRDSRVVGTRLLCERLAALASPPRVLVCASAIGLYGDRGEEDLDEDSAPGSGFLAGVCREWEAAAEPAREAGIRVVNLRFGVVLSPNGGALAAMLPPFRLGVGGPIGSGRQWMSWISLDDAISLALYCIFEESVSGPVNAVSPSPIRQRDFAHALGAALRRPSICPAPAFALRLLFGEMADETLLASQRVLPRAAQAAGYAFLHPDPAPYLRAALGRPD